MEFDPVQDLKNLAINLLHMLVDRATRLGGSPHLSCKRDQIKMRDYMDRRVTPPYRVTSPTWGPPPPCKQALTNAHRDMIILVR